MPADGGRPQLRLLKLNHLNAIVDGYDSAVDHFVGRLGCQLNLEIRADPAQGRSSPYGASDACLVTLGGVIFELFAPHARTERGQGRLLALYGDHYLGAEYQVPDIRRARETCRSLGIRVVGDQGDYFFTHPAEGFGVSFQLYGHDWHAAQPPFPEFDPVRPPAYWRDAHPLGITGLSCLRVVVDDLDGAARFYETTFGATSSAREERPWLGATARRLLFADTTIELLAPTGPGEITAFLDRYGCGLRSTVFRVVDLDAAERHLASRAIPLLRGDDATSRLLDPVRNHGLRFELSAHG